MGDSIIVLTITKEEIEKLTLGTGVKITNSSTLIDVVKTVLGAYMKEI